MASRVRIVTINKGEEAIIRVNSGLPITLEFPGHLVSCYEKNGLVFQRIEKQFREEQTQEDDEIEVDDNQETQIMDSGETQVFTQIEESPPPTKTAPKTPPILLRNLNLRSRRISLYQDIQDLQSDLFN